MGNDDSADAMTKAESPKSESTVPAIDPAVICQPVTDGAVLFHTASEVYFGLNETGLAIWRRLEEKGATLASVYAAVSAEFPDADSTIVERDVQALIEALLEYGLLRRAEVG